MSFFLSSLPFYLVLCLTRHNNVEAKKEGANRKVNDGSILSIDI